MQTLFTHGYAQLKENYICTYELLFKDRRNKKNRMIKYISKNNFMSLSFSYFSIHPYKNKNAMK